VTRRRAPKQGLGLTEINILWRAAVSLPTNHHN